MEYYLSGEGPQVVLNMRNTGPTPELSQRAVELTALSTPPLGMPGVVDDPPGLAALTPLTSPLRAKGSLLHTGFSAYVNEVKDGVPLLIGKSMATTPYFAVTPDRLMRAIVLAERFVKYQRGSAMQGVDVAGTLADLVTSVRANGATREPLVIANNLAIRRATLETQPEAVQMLNALPYLPAYQPLNLPKVTPVGDAVLGLHLATKLVNNDVTDLFGVPRRDFSVEEQIRILKGGFYQLNMAKVVSDVDGTDWLARSGEAMKRVCAAFPVAAKAYTTAIAMRLPWLDLSWNVFYRNKDDVSLTALLRSGPLSEAWAGKAV